MTSSLDNDLPMLELFHMEVESNSRTLKNGLVGVVGNQTPEKMEPLMRAAHSIKGAARMLGLDLVVGLGSAMENLLSAAQLGKITLSGDHLGLLSSSNELLINLSQVPPKDIPGWLKSQEPPIQEIKLLLQEVLEGKAPPAAAQPKNQTTPSPTPSPEKPVPESAVSGVASSSSAAAPTPSAVPEAPIDLPMMELFHVEVETHSRTLENGLVAVESNQSPEKVEPLMRAAHSIKGAARMVGLDVAVKLGHAMENILSAAQHGKMTMSGDHIDLLLRGNDVFLNLAKVQPKDIPAWLQSQEAHIQEIKQVLFEISEGKPAKLPESPLQAAKPAEPHADKPAESQERPKVESKEKPQPNKQDKQEKGDKEYVRIQASKLTNLIGLSGECLIQAKSAKAFAPPILAIKNDLRQSGTVLRKLSDAIRAGVSLEKVLFEIDEMAKKQGRTFGMVEKHLERVELLSSSLESLADQLNFEVISVRMRPFAEGTMGFPRMIRDLSKELGKKISFQIVGSTTLVDSNILGSLESPLTHLLRNAVDHGLETPDERVAQGKHPEGKLTLEAHHRSGMLEITVTDDGRGVDLEFIRKAVVKKGYVSEEMAAKLTGDELGEFLFLPGFSTAKKVTEVSGRGVGLDIVLTMIQDSGGSKSVETVKGKGTTFRFQLPLTLSVRRVLIVQINDEPYALPLFRIERLLEIDASEVDKVEDRQVITLPDGQIGLISAQQLLQMPLPEHPPTKVPVVVITSGSQRYGIAVDRFLAQKELVINPLDARLGKVNNFSSGGILEDGKPVLIIDVGDLVATIEKVLGNQRLVKIFGDRKKVVGAKKKVLIVDDSLTVREVERRVLENNGYEVIIAVDGADGWATIQKNASVSMVISDIDMPRMNGFEFVAKIKNDPNLKHIPVMMISYKDREEDRIKGMNAGANYFLPKSSFQDATFLNAVHDLIGEP